MRCKKDPITPAKTTKTPVLTPGSPDYAAQFGATEIGTATVPPDPTFNNTINGYSDKTSYNPGDTVTMHLSGPYNINTTITLYDTQGNAVFETRVGIKPQTIKSSKPWAEGFMYDKTFAYTIPAYFRSGIYTWNKTIPMVIKNNNKSVNITVIYPSNTINAYNYYGGKSLYAPDGNNRSLVASFQRSTTINYGNFYKWLDEQAYSINYVADCDMDDYNEISESSIVIITGHSEYWTRAARQNIDKFINSGRNVLVLSGNTMWWQVRYAPQQNLMICYKGNGADPLSGTELDTVNWCQKSLDYPVSASIGADYTEGGFGQTLPDRWDGYKIVNANSPLFEGTGLKNGDMLDIKSTEYDSVPVVEMIAPGSGKIPVIDLNKLNCYKAELLAYDFAQNLLPRAHKQQGLGTFVVYKRSEGSGTVVNVATMDWCWYIIFDQFKTITKNMIELSLNDKSLFS